MTIEYDYGRNARWHWREGPKAVNPHLFAGHQPTSLLDVGCGPGIWLKAALDYGVSDVVGLDGIELPNDQFVAPRNCFRLQDLTAPWNLGRSFDVAVCLEVAEHVQAEHGETLIESLTRHSDQIFFSAACPNQLGQHHVNCQWPVYWQELFNRYGFACSDGIRWKIWNLSSVEPWYRQNSFMAMKDPKGAGREPRLDAVVHPEMLAHLDTSQIRSEVLRQIEGGNMVTSWYLRAGCRAFKIKLGRIPGSVKRLVRGIG